MSTFDTPWFVEGALHSANVARNLAYTVLNGVQGIVGAADCVVEPLGTPGASVTVAPGTLAVLARGLADEMYVGKLPAEDTVDIAATDATGGRSDLIVARVVNPQYETVPAEWPAIDTQTGPYMLTYVLSGVPASVTSVEEIDPNISAVTLARIDVPISTSTITADMITDLRTPAKAGVISVPSGTPLPPNLPDGTLFVEYEAT